MATGTMGMIYVRPMAPRRRHRPSNDPDRSAGTSEYLDREGNALMLRNRLSSGTLRKLADLERGAAASADDLWHRRGELLFERLTVSWTLAGLPLTGQKELLGRYRMADGETRRWIRETIVAHLRRHQPEADV